MSRYDDRWPRYVPVAERRQKAAREMEKLRKKGHPVAPVAIEGRAIATTFWGKAWCENLESYHDYENRLPRGRTYVRNGSVIDLQVAPLAVTALVSGSSIYKVSVGIAAVAEARWRSIRQDCAGGIDSLVELLQGRFSKGVMERLCRQDGGLFPRPSEIKFSCSCPDVASMCKHVAAVLYGVGARLDERPELLFRLRAVDGNDLVANVDAALPLVATGPAAGKVLEGDDLSALFGLDMADAALPPATGGDAPVPAVKRKAKEERKKAVAAAEPVVGADESGASTPPQPAARSKRGGRGKAEVPPRVPATTAGAGAVPASLEPSKPAPPAERPKASRISATVKPDCELTPEGYVKWWK